MVNNSLRIKNARFKRAIDKQYSERSRLRKERRILYNNKDYNALNKVNDRLDSMNRSGSPTKYVNRCLITSRSGGLVNYNFFGMCNTKIREHANLGHIPGVQKR